ncbi:hypothetical protein, partial [Pseudomonas aeruginosa]|uniref:hypothetical protein n=1 Tax=Pseudomonas aeruginosa TaxID=287 RepID=UPI0031B74D16
DDSRELLARCGIKINLHTQRLIAMAENMPIDILRVRDDDIPGLVMDGVVDLGIIGENVLEEELLNRRARATLIVGLRGAEASIVDCRTLNVGDGRGR